MLTIEKLITMVHNEPSMRSVSRMYPLYDWIRANVICFKPGGSYAAQMRDRDQDEGDPYVIPPIPWCELAGTTYESEHDGT